MLPDLRREAGNSQFLTYENQVLTEENGLEDRVLSQPDCDDTGDCAP